MSTPLDKIATSRGRIAQLEPGATVNGFSRISDVNPIIDYLNARTGLNASSSTQTGTTNTTNALAGKVTFSSQSIAGDAVATYTITNSYVAATSIVMCVVTAGTSGGAPVISKVVPSAGSFTIQVVNETGTTTYTSITVAFIVF